VFGEALQFVMHKVESTS